MSVWQILGRLKLYQNALQLLTALHLTGNFFPEQPDAKDCAKYDFIIIGGGTAGCVVANRLSELENITVLLIEAGGNPPIESVIPGYSAYMRGTEVDWNYYGENDGYTHQHHKKKSPEVSRGKMLGGSSSINLLAYTRGNFHDFDKWANLTNDPSWGWEMVLPYFKKSEDLDEQVSLTEFERSYHGKGGYLGVTKTHYPGADRYLNAYSEIGNDIVDDINGNNPLGYIEAMTMVKNNIRQSTAQSFITPIKNRTNLYVLRYALATKIIFNKNNRAIGVKTLVENKKNMIFKAKREVIVSGGVINSPQILMLSGIGPKKHLEDMDIPVISDLPVGENLQDHAFTMLFHGMDKVSQKSKLSNLQMTPIPFIMGYKALKKSQKYPDYEDLSLVLRNKEQIVHYCNVLYGFNGNLCQNIIDSTEGREVLFTTIGLLYPKSKGKILLRSTDPKEPPRIFAAYYTENIDLENQVDNIEDFIRIQNSTLFKTVHAKLVIPKECNCDKRKLFSRQFWKCFAICQTTSGYHFVGTCSMKAVVDSRLFVYGVKNLRVVDSSIMPTIPGAHTNAAVIMIGEKAADMIKEDVFNSNV